MAITHEEMRAVLIEHVEAENARDAGRVLATYSLDGPVFEDAATGRRYEGGDMIVAENYQHLWDGFPGLRREITDHGPRFGSDRAGASRQARWPLPEPATHR